MTLIEILKYTLNKPITIMDILTIIGLFIVIKGVFSFSNWLVQKTIDILKRWTE